MSPLHHVRIVAFLEGVSFLMLLFVAMPLSTAEVAGRLGNENSWSGIISRSQQENMP